MEALLYDVHGNLPALEAVLADAPPARYVLGGDYALFGGWPLETVERLQELPDALWIRGNGERWTANPQDAPENPVVPGAIEFARAALGEQLVGDLGALPTSIAHAGTLICHASPRSDARVVPARARRRRGRVARGRHRLPPDLRPHPPARSAAWPARSS